jgi:hypothetical protein
VMVGLNLTKVYYEHVWKCHNEIPHLIQLIYVNKDIKLKNSSL